MDGNFKAILDSLPKKRQRSNLEPYTELINQLRRRGHTDREITCILAEKCDLVVASSTIVRFVAVRSKARRKCSKHRESRMVRNTGGESINVNVSSDTPDDNVWQRMEALKQRSAKIVRPSKQFEYDPDQPLHLVQQPGRNKTSQ